MRALAALLVVAACGGDPSTGPGDGGADAGDDVVPDDARLDGGGAAVALDGDTAAIGAPEEDGAGAVRIYRRGEAGWALEARLPGPAAGALFGRALALEGDRLAVGAPGANQVHVFTRAGADWTPDGVLQPVELDGGDQFGWAVALDGDAVAIGAPLEDSAATGPGGDPLDNSAQDAGAAYLFTRGGPGWSQVVYLKASNTEDRDGFGYAIALDAGTVAVGADQEASAATGLDGDQVDNSAYRAGAVYLFAEADGVWSQAHYVKASNTGRGDRFGAAVALDGDRLAIGAPYEDSAGAPDDDSVAAAGAAYLLERDGATWVHAGYLKAPSPATTDAFGVAVAVIGDAVVAGAYLRGDDDAGAAYMFAGGEVAALAPATPVDGARFGAAVALDAAHALVGADREGALGAAYLFARSP